MKKWSIAILFLLSSICLFAQDIFGAAKFGTPQDVLAAIKAGASLNERDNLGMTPLMWAAMNNTNPEVITALLKAGAKKKKKSLEGKTAFDYAKDNPNIKDTAAYWALNNARF